jgi:hypothetical protein
VLVTSPPLLKIDGSYDSDSSEESFVMPSSSKTPESYPAGDPAFERYKGIQFIIVNYITNIRAGSEVSKI